MAAYSEGVAALLLLQHVSAYLGIKEHEHFFLLKTAQLGPRLPLTLPLHHFRGFFSFLPPSAVISCSLIMNPTGVLFIRQTWGERGQRARLTLLHAPHRGTGTGILIGEQCRHAGQRGRHTVHANLSWPTGVSAARVLHRQPDVGL